MNLAALIPSDIAQSLRDRREGFGIQSIAEQIERGIAAIRIHALEESPASRARGGWHTGDTARVLEALLRSDQPLTVADIASSLGLGNHEVATYVARLGRRGDLCIEDDGERPLRYRITYQGRRGK